jgi:hypothetical protein
MEQQVRSPKNENSLTFQSLPFKIESQQAMDQDTSGFEFWNFNLFSFAGDFSPAKLMQ